MFTSTKIQQLAKILFTCILLATDIASAKKQPTPIYNFCNDSQARWASLLSFEKKIGFTVIEPSATVVIRNKGLNILVTQFSGNDPASTEFGSNIGPIIAEALPQYTKQNIDPRLLPDLASENIQVHYLPCIIKSHEHAAEIGRAADVDMVFWGQAIADGSNVDELRKLILQSLKAQNINIGNNNVVDAKSGSKVNIGVVFNINSQSGGAFKPRLTIVRGPRGQSALIKGADNTTGLQMDRKSSLLTMEFPVIAAGNVLALFDWFIGKYAFDSHNYAVAVQFLEKSIATFAGKFTSDIGELYSLIGISYVNLHQSEKAVNNLKMSMSFCKNDAYCSYQCNYFSGIALDQGGKYIEALVYFEEAKREADQEASLGAGVYCKMGLTYAHVGQSDKGIEVCKIGYERYRSQNNSTGQRFSLRNMASIYWEAGRHEQAINALLEARNIKTILFDPYPELLIVDGLLNYYAEIRKYKEALSYAEEAMKISDEAGFGEHSERLRKKLAMLRRLVPQPAQTP